ncbi:MAG TPA: TetR/AcrR family transcriptional regulator [bacterium]|nr:TetR/AcrR family transcriptional regulator [bacterium]
MKTKSEEKRLAILKAAFAVVTEKGYFETKVDDVAHRAGVAKGTVYLYFKDKPAIYIGLVDSLLEQALAITAAVLARPISPQQKLEELFSSWASGVMSNPGVMALLSMENVHQDNTVMKRFKKQVLPHIVEMQDAIAGVVKQGIEQGEFRPVDPRSAAAMYLSAFRAELLSINRHTAARRAESIQELFFCGILADGRGRTKHGDK